MFYQKFIALCNERGISPSKAALEMGLSKAANTGWASGKVPRDATKAKIADYFNVPVEYFDGEPIAGTGKAPASGTDTEANYMMELFTQLDGERRKQAVAFLLSLRQGSGEDKR